MSVFFVYYLLSLSPFPLTRSNWCIEIVVSVNLFTKSLSDLYFVDFL